MAGASIYGTDTSCGPDGYRPGVLVSGVELVREAIYRRLSTRRGQLLDDPDYGLPLSTFICATYTEDDAERIAGQIRNEILKDDRVERVVVDSNVVESVGGALGVTIELDCRCGAGPFSLTVSIGQLEARVIFPEAV